jgi:Uma2 family endonuclease
MLYWQREMSRFESREEKRMAMFSQHNRFFEETDWTGRPMSEEEYYKLAEISPERKYEYIKGVAYMMSGGSIEHDQITYHTRVALTRRLRAGPCRIFGTDVQGLLEKKNGKAHFAYPDATVSWSAAAQRRGNTLVEQPRAVVEVLSSGTEARDRGMKFKACRLCPTIQEIVLANQYVPYV